jgi:hypothetical protein
MLGHRESCSKPKQQKVAKVGPQDQRVLWAKVGWSYCCFFFFFDEDEVTSYYAEVKVPLSNAREPLLTVNRQGAHSTLGPLLPLPSNWDFCMDLFFIYS